MAESYYTLSVPGVSFILNKCIIGMYNGVGSGRVIRLKRIWMLNNQTTAVTGVGVVMELQRFTTASGGYAVSPIKHDSANPVLPAQLVFSTNPTFTKDVTMRRVFWSSDEPVALGVGTMDEVQVNPAYGLLWDSAWSYTVNSPVEPIVLRPGYGAGLVVINSTATLAGICDTFMEFSVDTS